MIGLFSVCTGCVSWYPIAADVPGKCDDLYVMSHYLKDA